jgi:hypothetical protein
MKRFLHAAMASALIATSAGQAVAHPPNASDASTLSMLPVAVSVAAPVMILSAGASLTIVAVEATSAGTVWALERASDGARASVTLSGQAAAGLTVTVGTAVVVTAFSAGWVLSEAGKAIAYIPNAIGSALLYNERITP